MSKFRTGNFDRGRVAEVWHPFMPAHAASSLHAVDLHELWSRGKRLLLLDVDNTLVQWRGEAFAEPVLKWVQEAKQLGFEICIISNTRRESRLQRLSEILGVATVRGKFKPSRTMFLMALEKFKREPSEAIMIGDQIFTDVLGANRTGIDAIWVQQMEGKEFGPTKISRMGERLLTGQLYRALVSPIDEIEPAGQLPIPIRERAIVRQFIKFAVVGGSSFVIDYSIRMTLLFAVPAGGGLLSDEVGRWLRASVPLLFGGFTDNRDAFYPLVAIVGGAFGILNSFIWNRKWTFGIHGKEGRTEELRKFVLVSVTGLIWNVLISSFLNHVLPFDSKMSARLATLIATGIVMFWNFGGQRLYAFRKKAK